MNVSLFCGHRKALDIVVKAPELLAVVEADEAGIYSFIFPSEANGFPKSLIYPDSAKATAHIKAPQ